MPGAYSGDLRERAVAAAGCGLSTSGAARVPGVSVSIAIRWTRRLREAGSAAARPCGGDARSKLTAHAAWSLAVIGGRPDLALAGIRHRLRAERAAAVGHGAVWRFFASRGASFKENAARHRTGTRGRRRGTRSVAQGAALA